MVEIRKTETFAKWLDGLDDIRARARIWYGLNDWQQEIPEMLSPWVKAFQSCGSITDQVTAFITQCKVDPWSFCWLVVTSAPSPGTSKPPCV